MRVSAL